MVTNTKLWPPEASSKRASIDVSIPSVTVHVPVPEQPPPDQPLKREPPLAVAVRVTIDPRA